MSDVFAPSPSLPARVTPQPDQSLIGLTPLDPASIAAQLQAAPVLRTGQPLTAALASTNALTGPIIGAFNAPGAALARVGSLGGPRAPALDTKYPEHLASLTNKYAELSKEVSALPEAQRNALIQYDSARVAKGASPLTKEQTRLVIQTLQSGEAATAPPDRKVGSVLTNFRSDLSDILKSVPRIPLGIMHEATDLPHIGERIQENRAHGMNEVAAVLNAPGVRMIPGSFTLGNLAQGGKGVKELATHPLQTFLDVLPAAHSLAAGTDVAKAAAELSEAAGKRPRPLTAVLTGKVLRDDAGNLVRGEITGLPTVGRNRLGEAVDLFRDETRVGQALDSFGGARSREVNRIRGTLEQRLRGMSTGYMTPANGTEQLVMDGGTLLHKYADVYPFLAKDATGPEAAAQRAALYEGIQRTPDAYDPRLVSDLRDFQYRAAKAQEEAGHLASFDGEWFDAKTAKNLRSGEAEVAHHRRINEWMPHVLDPGGVTIDQLRSMVDDVSGIASKKQRKQAALAVEHIMDAHGIDPKPLSSTRAAIANREAHPAAWGVTAHGMLDEATLTPRRTLTDVLDILRQKDFRRDPQAARLRDAIATGNRKLTTDVLNNLMSRKPPALPDEMYPGFRDDARSLSRRIQYQSEMKRFTPKRLEQVEGKFQNLRNKTAPARFHGLLSDEYAKRGVDVLTDEAERQLGRRVTPDEAGQIAESLARQTWGQMPGIDAETAQHLMRQVNRDVTATWRELRDAGADPVFVHKVSPGRANQALAGNVGPVAERPSQGKERVMDLTPGVQDLGVSLRHQAGEILQEKYNTQFADDVIQRVGTVESELRERFADEAQRRAVVDPELDFEGHLQRIIARGFDKFNPDEAGRSWGGAKLDRYRQENWYIPKSVASNLHEYAKPPSLFTAAVDPITKAFRYTVLGLSPSVIVNNFFSNAVAVTAESGPGFVKYWGEARKWLDDPSLIPNEQLKGMFLAEHPQMEYLSRSWLNPRTADRVMNLEAMQGVNAAHAFRDSAAAEAVKAGKSAMDGIVEKSLRLQQTGDNVYRGMQYMFERDKALRRGASLTDADHAAMESVRRTLVDYTSFTQVERAAMRTIIPFYSYMGHAARFIMRYPFDHPLRAALAAHIAAAERERLGTLPGSYLSMVPLPGFLGGKMGRNGKVNMLALRPLDPFGDISNLTSVSGWLAATNPVVQTALQQAGITRGEADLYPTLRYNPDTGRMDSVHGNILSDLVNNTIPRAGLLTAALGFNKAYNETRAGDPNAANRMLVSMAGLPRAWRSVSPVQDVIKSEVARQTSANDVRNDALKSGNWSEAMRYPSLRAAYAELAGLDPSLVAQYQPATPQAIAALITRTADTEGHK